MRIIGIRNVWRKGSAHILWGGGCSAHTVWGHMFPQFYRAVCVVGPGVLRVGDEDPASVRVDDRHPSRSRGKRPEEPRRNAHLHHPVQGEVRHSNHDAGTTQFMQHC